MQIISFRKQCSLYKKILILSGHNIWALLVDPITMGKRYVETPIYDNELYSFFVGIHGMFRKIG